MKRFVVIGLVIILTIAVVAFVYTRTTQLSQKSVPVPISTIAPLSSLPRKIDTEPKKVSFVYSGPAVAFPNQLPTYGVVYPTDLSGQAASLVKQWGFTTAVKKPVPYVFDWIEDDKQFSYDQNAKSISLNLYPPLPVGLPLSTLTPSSLFSTLTSFGFLSDRFSFTETGRGVVQEEGEGGTTSKSNVTIITYTASIINQRYPFFFSGFSKTTGEIRINSSGNVVSFSFYITPQIKQEQDRTILGSADQILQELNNQKGYLAGLGTTISAYPFIEDANYSSVTVASISLGYLYVPEEVRFVPIAVVEGTGNGPTPQRVRYYVRISS